MKLFHKIIFWTHLIAGVIAGLVIFIMSVTGVVLMYEPQISEFSERNARWVTPQGPNDTRPQFNPHQFVREGGTLYSLSKEGAGTAGPLVTAGAPRGRRALAGRGPGRPRPGGP